HNDQRGQPGGVNVTPSLSFMSTIRPPVGFNTPAVGAGSIDATDSNRLNGAINDILGIPARLSQVFLGDLSADEFLPFRSGITWSPNPKLVIRSGYGIAFDPISSFQVTAVSGRVPGLTFSCSSTVGGATTPGCATVPDVRIGQGFPLELPPPNTKPSSFLTP